MTIFNVFAAEKPTQNIITNVGTVGNIYKQSTDGMGVQPKKQSILL